MLLVSSPGADIEAADSILCVMRQVACTLSSTTHDSALMGMVACRDLKKPVGALNSKRLAQFQERYVELEVRLAAAPRVGACALHACC